MPRTAVRRLGRWEDVDLNEGTGPDAVPQSEGTEVSFGSMKRAELDAYARGRGLDPTEYRNKDDLIAALEQ